MTIKRIFCMIMAVIGGLGVIGSLPLKMIRGTSLGPGMMPMLYSIALILLAAVFALTDNGKIRYHGKVCLFSLFLMESFLLHYVLACLLFCAFLEPRLLWRYFVYQH